MQGLSAVELWALPTTEGDSEGWVPRGAFLRVTCTGMADDDVPAVTACTRSVSLRRLSKMVNRSIVKRSVLET